MRKMRSTQSTTRGYLILESTLLPDGTVVAEVTGVDTHSGKNVCVGLEQKAVAILFNHGVKLRREYKALKAKEAAALRKAEIGEV